MQYLVDGVGIIVKLHFLLVQQLISHETKNGGCNTQETKYNKQLTIHRIVGKIAADEH